MTERCPICGLDTFAEDVIRTGYLNSSTIRKCSNCTWQKVIRLSGPGGPAIDKLVSESRKEFLQVLESTGSVRATAAELKSRAFKGNNLRLNASPRRNRMPVVHGRPRRPKPDSLSPAHQGPRGAGRICSEHKR